MGSAVPEDSRSASGISGLLVGLTVSEALV
jgi:hypothetical protein